MNFILVYEYFCGASVCNFLNDFQFHKKLHRPEQLPFIRTFHK